MKPTGATKEWRVEPRPIHGYQVIDSDGTEILADVYRKEDAQLIVTAVNERERLREVARVALDAFRYMRDVDPGHWHYHVTPEVCTAWDKLRAVLNEGPKE